MEQDDEEGGEGMKENLGRKQGDLWNLEMVYKEVVETKEDL